MRRVGLDSIRVNAAERRAIKRGEMEDPRLNPAPVRVNAADRRMINQGEMEDPRISLNAPLVGRNEGFVNNKAPITDIPDWIMEDTSGLGGLGGLGKGPAIDIRNSRFLPDDVETMLYQGFARKQARGR